MRGHRRALSIFIVVTLAAALLIPTGIGTAYAEEVTSETNGGELSVSAVSLDFEIVGEEPDRDGEYNITISRNTVSKKLEINSSENRTYQDWHIVSQNPVDDSFKAFPDETKKNLVIEYLGISPRHFTNKFDIGQIVLQQDSIDVQIIINVKFEPETYEVIKHFGTWSGSGPLSAEVNGDLSKADAFTRGKGSVNAYYYTLSAGTGNTTIVTLTEEYLSTLPNGAIPALAVNFPDGRSFEINLTIPPRPGIRIAGLDRYSTMSQIVYQGWRQGSDYAVVASGENFPDALAATSLAGVLDAPVVLTSKDELSINAEMVLSSLRVKYIYVIGGTAAVSDAVVSSIKNLSSVETVTRLDGADRVDTALKIYKEKQSSWSKTAIVASGANFPDALAISPYANATGAPIFLTDPNTLTLNRATADAINSGGFTTVIIVGGTSAVSGAVEGQLNPKVVRLSGADRYETSAKIASYSVTNSGGKLTYNKIILATGQNFPDALAGGALAGYTGTVILLIDDSAAGHHGINTILKPNKASITECYFVGGAAALPNQLLRDVNDALK